MYQLFLYFFEPPGSIIISNWLPYWFSITQILIKIESLCHQIDFSIHKIDLSSIRCQLSIVDITKVNSHQTICPCKNSRYNVKSISNTISNKIKWSLFQYSISKIEYSKFKILIQKNSSSEIKIFTNLISYFTVIEKHFVRT